MVRLFVFARNAALRTFSLKGQTGIIIFGLHGRDVALVTKSSPEAGDRNDFIKSGSALAAGRICTTRECEKNGNLN
jgi:hypothetical protein